MKRFPLSHPSRQLGPLCLGLSLLLSASASVSAQNASPQPAPPPQGNAGTPPPAAAPTAGYSPIGSNATILPVRICDDVVIGAGAVVTHDIDRPGIYAGVPARFLRTSGPAS